MGRRARRKDSASPERIGGGSHLSFDDPVPSDTAVFSDTDRLPFKPHSIERQVQRKLLASPHLKFSSLVVRRLQDGVCIEGVLEGAGGPDVCTLAQQVAGVNRVLNHLLVRDVVTPPADA